MQYLQFDTNPEEFWSIATHLVVNRFYRLEKSKDDVIVLEGKKPQFGVTFGAPAAERISRW